MGGVERSKEPFKSVPKEWTLQTSLLSLSFPLRWTTLFGDLSKGLLECLKQEKNELMGGWFSTDSYRE